jgi:hypothetical protein
MRNYIVLSLVLGLILFGCISTEVEHKQYADGSADISQITDISLFDSEYSYYSSYISEAFDELCDSYSSEVDCEEDGGVVTLSKKFSSSEAFYTFEVKDELLFKKYRLTVDELPDFNQYASDTDFFGDSYTSSYSSPYEPSSGGYYDYLDSDTIKLSDAKAKAMGKLMESMGMDYTYSVEMPGTIVEAEGAVEFDENTAEFDIVEMLQDRKQIVVVSEEPNWLVILFLVALVAFGILIAVIFFIKSGQPSVEMPSSRMETTPRQPTVETPRTGMETRPKQPTVGMPKREVEQ